MGVVRAVDARKKVLAAALLAASLAVSGCASQRVAFTQHLRTQYDLTGEELKKLQYYISSSRSSSAQGRPASRRRSARRPSP
jgi:sensor domain CHASE-containing protein